MAKDKNLGIPKPQIEEDFPGIENDWLEIQDLEAQWMETYNEVLRFVKKEERLPSQHSEDSYEKKLGKWCNRQRQVKKGNIGGIILGERESLLENIDIWYWESDEFNKLWMKNYNDLLFFVKKNNKMPSSTSKNKKEKKLGEWCSTQRRVKNGKTKYKMLKIREILLEKISLWEWNVENATTRHISKIWMQNYNKVLVFVKKEERTPSQHSKNKYESKLGRWCKRQKDQKEGRNKGGRTVFLMKEQIELLEKIKYWKWKSK